jgi:hypothetical protein
MKKFLITAVVLSFLSASYAQVGISGGISNLKSFGGPSFIGFNVGLELPIDDESSYYGRFSTYVRRRGETRFFQVEAIDLQNTNPAFLQINAQNSLNYNTIEFGRRQYLIGTFDNDFGLYGGSFVQLVFNSSKTITDDYDRTKYKIPTGNEIKGSVFGFAMGIHAGLKYSMSYGTFFGDASFNYHIPLSASNQNASDAFGELGGNLFFTFNVGFRKDLY